MLLTHQELCLPQLFKTKLVELFSNPFPLPISTKNLLFSIKLELKILLFHLLHFENLNTHIDLHLFYSYFY